MLPSAKVNPDIQAPPPNSLYKVKNFRRIPQPSILE